MCHTLERPSKVKKKIVTFPIVASCVSRGRRACKNFDERRRSGPGKLAGNTSSDGAGRFRFQTAQKPELWRHHMSGIRYFLITWYCTSNLSNNERPIPSFRIGNNITKSVGHRGGGMLK